MTNIKISDPLMPRDNLDTLIERALEQREVCIEHGWHEMARTFNDLARYLVGLDLARQM